MEAGCIRLEGNKVTFIDYLKGFSILTIVLMHLVYSMPSIPSPLLTLSSLGGTGVHVFFLCSGIGLYLSYLKRPMTWKGFLQKRFVKIYLPYILVVLLSFCLPWLYMGNQRLTALLSHIFLFKMFVPAFQTSFGIQLWFVSTIIQLYLLFIPMCRIKEKINNNTLFLVLFLAISIAWWLFCYLFKVSHMRVFNSAAFQFIWEFALGFVLAEQLYKGRSWKLSLPVLAILAVLGIGVQAFLALSADSLKLFNDIPALVGYTSLALLLGQIPLVYQLGTWLATVSYEFFLLHMLVINTLFHVIKPHGLLMEGIVAVLSLGASIVVAILYRRLLARSILSRIL